MKNEQEESDAVTNRMGKEIVDAAVKLHFALGPGLLESVYEVVLARELERRGLSVHRQVPVPIVFDGVRFDEGFRADLVVEERIIVELKSVEELNKVHMKQLYTYLRLKGYRLGYVLNFGAALMKDGIRRVANGISE